MKPRIRKDNSIVRRLRPSLLAWSVAACFAGTPAWALPTGAQVAAGAASFNQVGNSLTIANTPGAIINWNAFSIGALEAVRFDQQNSLSAVLNRVTGGSASAIHGALSSNGRVFLINPNGILFGAGSRIDVNGLIASTLNISDQDFLAGRLGFTAGDTAGGIRNAGTLQSSPGGNIYLIAPDIENSGIVRAPNGEVLLAAGRQVSLVDGAHPDIQVVVSAPADQAVNLGEIAGGKVSVFGALLTQRGTVSADAVGTDSAGRIVFRATKQLDVEAGSRTTANGAAGGTVVLQSAGDAYIRSTVEATGNLGQGGTIAALGERVAVLDQAVLDASGAAGGGRVMVGGDYQGRNPAVQNAQVTYFGPDATLRADAGNLGAGGTVIVWADDTTRAFGHIEARGGSQGGDGGFVETSGKQHLDFHASLDLAAPKGMGGTLLLDPAGPAGVIIADSRTTENPASESGGDPNIFTPSTDPTLITWSDINTAFSTANNVAITANGGAADSGNIDIQTSSFNQIGNAGSGDTLSFLATGNVSLTAAGKIELFGANTKLVAGWNSGSGVSSPTVVANTGSINVGGAGIATSGGASNGGTVSLIAGQNVATTAAISTGGGNLVINAGGTVTLGAQLSTTPSLDAPGGNITIQAGGNIDSATATTPITATSASSNTVYSGGTVQITSTAGNIALYTVGAKGSDALSGDTAGGNGGTVTITATSGDVSFSGASNGVFSQGGSSSGVGIGGTGGTVSISGANMSLGGIDVSGGTGSVAAYGGASGAINVIATGAVTANGYITASSPSNILSGGNIGIKGASLSFADAVSDVMTNNTGTITLETTSGAISQPAYGTGAIIQGPKLVLKSTGGIYGTCPTTCNPLQFTADYLDVRNTSGTVSMYGGSAFAFQDLDSDGYSLKLSGTSDAGFSTNGNGRNITVAATGATLLGGANLTLEAWDATSTLAVSQSLDTSGTLQLRSGTLQIDESISATSLYLVADSLTVAASKSVTATGTADAEGIRFEPMFTSSIALGPPVNSLLIDPSQLGTSGNVFNANYFEFDAGSAGSVTINSPVNVPSSLLAFEAGTVSVAANVTGKSISFMADSIGFSGTPVITAGTNESIMIAPYTASQAIVIAADSVGGALWIDSDVLNNTAPAQIVGNLQIGMATSGGTPFNSGAITISDAITGTSSTFPNLALVTSGAINQSAAITLPSCGGCGGLTLINGGTATLDNASNAIGSLTATGGGNLSLTNDGSLDIGSIDKSGASVTLYADALTQSGAIVASSLNVTSTSGGIALDSSNTVSTFTGNAATSLLFKNSGNFTTGQRVDANNGDITLYGGTITIDSDSFGVNADLGDVYIYGNATNYGSISIGSVADPVHTLLVSGNFSQTSMGSLQLHALDAANHGTVSVGGTASLSGSLSIGGTTPAGDYAVLSATTISGSFSSISPAGLFPTYGGSSVTLTAPGSSMNFVWDGNSDADGDNTTWEDPYNWTLDTTAPGAGAYVTIDSGKSVSLSSNAGTISALQCDGSLTINNGGSLAVTGNASIYDLVLSGNAQLTGAIGQALSVTNSFSQAATAAISGFGSVSINQSSAGISLGDISTSWSGNYDGSVAGTIILKAYADITQQAGTSLSASGVSAKITMSGNIDLSESNGVGVVAASTPDGYVSFKSTNAINVVDMSGIGSNGANGISAGSHVRLESGYSGAAFTQSASITAGGGLLLVGTGSSQAVSLTNVANDFSLFAIDLTSASTVDLIQSGASALALGSVDGTVGASVPDATRFKIVNAHSAGSLSIAQTVTVGPATEIQLSAGSGGITISQPIAAESISLRADGTISLAAALTASDWVQLSNRTAGGAFLIDSGNCTGACIDSTDFGDIEAPGGIVFGDDSLHATGALSVNTDIDTSAFAGATKPAFVALLSGSGSSDSIDIYAPITLPSGGSFVFNGYNITNSAGAYISAANATGVAANNAVLYFSGPDTSIVQFTPPAGSPQTFEGIKATGNLMLYHGVTNSFLDGGGTLGAAALSFNAGSIGAAANPLQTKTSSLFFNAQADGIFVTNNTVATPGALLVYGTANSSAPSGTVVIDNYGATTVTSGAISANGGVTVTAHSPLTIAGPITSSTGAVSLTSSNGDPLTVSSNISASTGVTLTAESGGLLSVANSSTVITSSGTITLAAGSVAGDGSVGGIPILSASFTSTTPPASTTLPSLDACILNPAAPGCSSVLPTLDTCVANPTALGCSAVLPTVDACVANPAASGCSAVLPSINTCVTNPAAPGCSAVLPTVSVCIANPATPGCSAVLPSINTCVTNPAAPGCSAVLPTVSACIANPATPGCSAVLPSINTCVTNPAAPGCAAVLPTVSVCIANPATPGCSAVLPSINTCVANPAAPGCSVVLPPPTLPTDQQLACLLDPSACSPGGEPPPVDAAQPIIQQVQSSEQQLVLNSQTGQSDSGRPDLNLQQTGSSSNVSGGGGSSGSAGSTSGNGQTSQSSGQSNGQGEGEGEGEGEQTGQNTPNNQQGANNAPPQRRFCN